MVYKYGNLFKPKFPGFLVMSSVLDLSAAEDGPALHIDLNCYSMYAFIFQHIPCDRTVM